MDSTPEQKGFAFRSLPILTTYLLLAIALVAHICWTLYSRWTYLKERPGKQPPSFAIALFLCLAILSLSFTWYYMFSFFAYTYHDWACRDGTVAETPVTLQKLELWLRGTKLFKEAWHTVIETPWRFWWSQQIFLWTTAWSLFIGVIGRRHKVPHAWTYMLLGQIVAISFAQNLFYIAVLLSLSDTASKGKADTLWAPHASLDVLPLLVSLISTALVPHTAHTSAFMLILLVPHLLLFIPIVLSPRALPRSLGVVHKSTDSLAKRGVALFKLILGVSIVLQAHATYIALQDTSPIQQKRSNDSCGYTNVDATYKSPVQRSITAMYEHPACSSVSWDVVFCTVGFAVWSTIHRFDPRKILGLEDVDNGRNGGKDE